MTAASVRLTDWIFAPAPEKVRGYSKFVMLDREISADDSFHALRLSSDTADGSSAINVHLDLSDFPPVSLRFGRPRFCALHFARLAVVRGKSLTDRPTLRGRETELRMQMYNCGCKKKLGVRLKKNDESPGENRVPD